MEDFLCMSCGQLKDYLSLRCLGTSGIKSELVARAFVAWEQKTPIKLASSALKAKLDKEYEYRLKLAKIPDPKMISDKDWKNDVSKWPLIDLGKIFTFILKHKEFDTDYIGKYKTEKAYSYFDSKFVGPILSTVVTGEEDVFILKADVTPSMKMHDAARRVWVCVKPDGEIVCTWCSCTAGFSQTCNHVIAVAYKVEFAITKDYHNPSSTSMSCKWNEAGRKDIRPLKIKDMDLRGASYHKGGSVSRKSTEARLAFEPRRLGDKNIQSEDVQKFLAGMEKVQKKAVLFTAFNKSPYTRCQGGGGTLPSTIVEAAEGLDITDDADEEVRMTTFMQAISLSPEQCQAIELSTRGQSTSDIWVQQRKGRITASGAHAIHTKVNTIMKKRKTGVISSTLQKIIHGGNDLSNIPAVEWGTTHEVDGKQAFYANEAIKHDKYSLQNPGLFVSSDLPFLAASPDYVLHCNCCGTSVIEIKCPLRLSNLSVKEHYSEVEFLHKVDDIVQLKTTHPYYTQILMQMAIAKAAQGYFVTWSPTDAVIQKIKFDSKHWSIIQANLSLFYKKYILPCLLNVTALNYCVACTKLCLWPEEVTNVKDRSAHCVTCRLWYHYTCMEITDTVAAEWTCEACTPEDVLYNNNVSTVSNA